jgi:hypothetical protein
MARSQAARTEKTLSSDESGTIDAMAYIFMVTIIGIGLVVGLTSVRDQLVQGLGDVADAMASVNQSYTVSMTFAQLNGPNIVQTFSYVDTVSPVTQTPGQAPHGIVICGAAQGEL